jgi:hypothetical protein
MYIQQEIFFLKHVGELRIIILRRDKKKGIRTPVQQRPYKDKLVTRYRKHDLHRDYTPPSTRGPKCLEKGKSLCSGQGPQEGFFPSNLENCCNTRRSPVEQTLISVLPNNP